MRSPLNDPDFFPLAVWLQSPENAVRYREAGINLYVGLWEGPTEAQLATLKAAGMPVICDQNAVGLAHRNDPRIVAWMQNDEPDNAQEVTDPKTGGKSWGPCVPPKDVVARYRQLRAADPTRPVLLNLGQGVANDAWVGRGAGAKLDDYRTYVQGGDIVSFDVYPVASGLPIRLIALGLDRLTGWAGERKPLWNCIECSPISGDHKVTPRQLRAEIWLSIIHGSRGLIYFVHQFQPKFNEHALLDDPPLLKAVTETNRQINSLASVINSPTIKDAVTVTPNPSAAPIDTMLKKQGDAFYLFTVGTPAPPSRVTFTIKGLPASAIAEALDEGRSIPVHNGRFEETFQPDDVHIYRIKGRS